MDHEMSVKTKAAEKYLLGELPPPEREAFEQHYFDCAECAESVRLGFQFGENARAVFAEEPRPVRRPEPAGPSGFLAWLRSGFLVPAAAALAIALAVYQNAVQIPALRARAAAAETPLVLSTVVLAPSARAEAPTVTLASRTPFIHLALATTAVPPAQKYQCTLRGESGSNVWTLAIPHIDPDSTVTLLVPSVVLSDGYYDAVLAGVTGTAVAEFDHYRFAVRRHD